MDRERIPNPEISIVIPVYRAESCLHELYRRLTQTLSLITESYEIILIEDCGGDRSFEIIKDLSAVDSRVRGFQFSRNFGQHFGITAGLDLSRGAWVIIMDCDLQDQPEEIPKLLGKAHEGYDVVLGSRAFRKDTVWKKFSSSLFYLFYNFLTGVSYDKSVAGFCALSRQATNAICQLRERDRYLISLINWIGFPTAKVIVNHAERFSGESSYSLSRRLKLAWTASIAYSTRPLTFSLQLGMLIASLSMVAGLVTLYFALSHNISVPGWASIIMSLYFLGGIGLTVLGLIGTYIARIADQQKERPLYIIRRSTEMVIPPVPEIYKKEVFLRETAEGLS